MRALSHNGGTHKGCPYVARRLPPWEDIASIGKMSDLRKQVSSLSVQEKVDLLDAVWESLEADSSVLTDAQRAELDFRIQRHEQNAPDLIPWELSKKSG